MVKHRDIPTEEKVSRRKLLSTIGLTGAAAFVTQGLSSNFGMSVLAATDVNKASSDKSARYFDDASQLSYRYDETLPKTTVGDKLRNSISVTDFGAVGDGKTDDTEAFNAAIKQLNKLGGGVLYIPNNDHSIYLLKDRVVLCDNLQIFSNGAILKKDATCNNYYIFVSLSGEKQGYGSGASNIIIDGLTIEGSFKGSIGASITLHHSQNVRIKNCIFKESVIGGHSIDLGGCSEIVISNCLFKGFHVQKNREYVEAIQIDHSTAEGIGTDSSKSYDGLACKNIIVRECNFLPLELNSTVYPAPNPFGSHSRVVGHNFKNIKFVNNYVEDGSTVPEGAPYSAGLLHFYHIDGLEISGNVFINNQGNSARVLGLYSIETAIGQKDVAVSNPTKIEYDPVPAKNVWFEKNTIIGFNNATISRIIYLQGREVKTEKYFLENICITGNSFIDCYDHNASSTNVSSDIVFADKVMGLNVSNNYCSSVRRLLYGTDCWDTHIVYNRLYKAYYVPVSIDQSSNIHLTNNIIDDFRGGFYLREINRLQVKDNTFVNEIDDIVAAYGQILSVNQGSKFMIKDNYIEGSDSDITRAISVYESSQNGRIKDNWIVGFNDPIRVSEDSQNIVVDESLLQ